MSTLGITHMVMGLWGCCLEQAWYSSRKVAGIVPVLIRRLKGRWLERHATFMNIAYLGLVAATAAEITSRMPGFEEHFGLVVGLTSALIIGAGAVILFRNLPNYLRRNKWS